MDIVTIAIIAVLIGLVIGVSGGYLGRRIVSGKKYAAAQTEAAHILEESRDQQRTILLEAKEEAIKVRSDAESDLKERRSEAHRIERRVANREENVERRATNLERRERSLTQKEKAADDIKASLDEIKEQQLKQL